MNFRLSNYSSIWVPIYQFHPTGYYSFWYIFWSFIYFFLLIISAYFSLLLLRISWTIQKFHRNMTTCFVFTFGTWFEIGGAMIVTWPYEAGWIVLNDSEAPPIGVETTPSLITHVENTLPLLVASFIIWHYLATIIGGLLMFVVERAIASFCFGDYEKKPRKYIAILLLIFSQFFALNFSFLALFHVINLRQCLIIMSTCVIFVILTFIFLVYYNTAIQAKLDLSHSVSSYTLASKFQAAENARSLKLAQNVVAVIFVLIILALLMVIVSVLKIFGPEVESASSSIFYAILTLNPLFVVPSAMQSVVEWRQAFLQNLPIVANRIKPATSRVFRRDSQESDLYFVQLRETWARV